MHNLLILFLTTLLWYGATAEAACPRACRPLKTTTSTSTTVTTTTVAAATTSTVTATTTTATVVAAPVATQTSITTSTNTVTDTSSRTVATSTVTVSNTMTSTQTRTVTRTTATVTVTRAPNAKRDPIASLLNVLGIRDGVDCSGCRTVTERVSSVSTSTVTTTPVTTVTASSTATVSPTVTTSTTVYLFTTTTATVDVTATSTSTVSPTVTITTTTTTKVVATKTVAPVFRGPSCNNANTNTAGAGGCSSNCYCDLRKGQSKIGVCNAFSGCGRACQSDLDCPNQQVCASGPYYGRCPGGSTCVRTNGCTSTYNAKKRAVGMEVGAWLGRVRWRDVPVLERDVVRGPEGTVAL